MYPTWPQSPFSIYSEFLKDEFLLGKEYRTLNGYRSAISGTHLPIEGYQVGKHPLIARLFKGIFHLRPSQPRYTGRWKVETVLNYITSLGLTSTLSLRCLTHKLAMLMALANADRASDLHALDTRYVTFDPRGALFRLADLTKTTRPGKQRVTSFYSYFDDNPTLCPVRTLKHYLQVTTPFREKSESNRNGLFLSVVKPHLPVTSATIARWIRDLLRCAGVSPEFTAHSTRSTAVSVAFEKGISVAEILRTADWSAESTFRRFYYKPES